MTPTRGELIVCVPEGDGPSLSTRRGVYGTLSLPVLLSLDPTDGRRTTTANDVSFLRDFDVTTVLYSGRTKYKILYCTGKYEYAFKAFTGMHIRLHVRVLFHHHQ